jgi:hypothetical protein
MEQPDGFEQGKPSHVLRLRKSLYGLNQVPRVWNEKLNSALQEMGFTKVHCDKSIYMSEEKGIKVCCLCDLACLLYVLWRPCGPVARLCVAWECWLMSWSGTVT